MFGRVTWRGGRSRNLNYPSIVLGKKWTKKWSLPEGISLNSTITSEQEQTLLNPTLLKKIEEGWIEFDRDNNKFIFPPIDGQLLNNLPDGVGPDVPDQDWVGNTRRVLIGDGTSFVGPLTWNEACKLLHVAKIIQPSEGYLPTASASGSISSEDDGSASVSVTSGNGAYAQIGNFSSESNPFSLFRYPSFLTKSKSESIFDQNNSSVYGTRASASTLFRTEITAFTNAPIAIDVDKPEDFYVGFFASSRVEADAYTSYSFFGYKSKDVAEAVSLEQTYYVFRSGSSEGFGPNNTTRTLVFDSSQEYTSTVTYTYPFSYDTVTTEKEIEKNGSLKIGSKTLQLKMYGFRREINVQRTEGGEGATASVEANISHPPPEFTVSEWWPYKNADGQPVWNTSTGTLVNSPLP